MACIPSVSCFLACVFSLLVERHQKRDVDREARDENGGIREKAKNASGRKDVRRRKSKSQKQRKRKRDEEEETSEPPIMILPLITEVKLTHSSGLPLDPPRSKVVITS